MRTPREVVPGEPLLAYGIERARQQDSVTRARDTSEVHMSEHPAMRRRSRGANGDGGGRQRADGLWEWRITVPGTNRRISTFATTKAEARRKSREKLSKELAGLDTKGGQQTLGAFLERWLADVVQPQLAPKTSESYRDTVRNHIIPTLGK